MMRRLFALLLCLAPGCAHSVDDDLAGLRTEIVALEKKRIEQDGSMWIHTGAASFDKYVEDGDDRIPDYIYYHVLRKFKEGRAEDFQKSARTDFDWSRCMGSPVPMRGNVYRLNGVITGIKVENIPDPASPVSRVYAGVLYMNGESPVFFHLVEKPDLLRLKEDTVEIDGLFFKVLSYRGSSGKMISAPFFIAKSMRKFI